MKHPTHPIAILFKKIIGLFKRQETIPYLRLHILSTTNDGWARRMWMNRQIEHYKV